jgi:hypothetical protein
MMKRFDLANGSAVGDDKLDAQSWAHLPVPLPLRTTVGPEGARV